MHLSAQEGRRELLLIAHILKEVMQSCGVQRKGNEGEWPSSSLFNTNSRLQSLQSLFLRVSLPPSLPFSYSVPCTALWDPCPHFSLSSHPSVSSVQQNTSLFPTKRECWHTVERTHSSLTAVQKDRTVQISCHARTDLHFWQLPWHHILICGSQVTPEVLDNVLEQSRCGVASVPPTRTPEQPAQITQDTRAHASGPSQRTL